MIYFNIKTSKTYLFVPNCIGYVRILFLGLGFSMIKSHPIEGSCLIMFSDFMDAFDGFIARKLNQISQLGVILDYSIDRMMTGCFFLLLATCYPNAWLVFCFLLGLDMISHLFRLYATNSQGKTNHKETDASDSFILKLYYNNRIVLFLSCFSHDFFFLFLFLYSVYPYHWIYLLLLLLGPGALFKITIHIIQLLDSIKKITH